MQNYVEENLENSYAKTSLELRGRASTSGKLLPAFGSLQKAFGSIQSAFGEISESDSLSVEVTGLETQPNQHEEKHKKTPSIPDRVIRELDKCGFSAKGMNFSIRLVGVKEIVKEEPDGEYWRTVYKFVIMLGSNEYFQDVDATELESFTWIKKATKGRAYVESAQGGSTFKSLVHKVLEIGLSEVDMEIYYLRNGWKRLQGGNWFYVCNHGIVGQPDQLIHGCDELDFQIDSVVVPMQNFFDFINMEKITRRPEFSRCFMTFTSLSVMSSLFEEAGFPVKFILGVLGTTNAMKTSAALVFTNIFNALKPQKPEVTFSSTKHGIETMVSRYSDGVLLVDDFMPADSKKKQAELNSKLELLCRLYGDRTPIKRMLDFCEKKVEYPVKGCCVFTGEHLTGVESSRTRILVLKLEKGDVQKDILGFYQENPLILPTYLYGFIAYIQRHIEQILKFISKSVQVYRKAADYKIARLNEAQAVMFTAADIMEMYWKDESFVTSDSRIGDEWKNSIEEVVIYNERQLSEVSVSEVIIQALREKILQDPQDCKPVEEIQKTDRRKIYYDTSCVYIRAEDLYIVVKEYCGRYDHDFYFQKSMLIDKLKEADILETQIDEKGHECAARKLKQGKGITARYLFLKRKKIEKND